VLTQFYGDLAGSGGKGGGALGWHSIRSVAATLSSASTGWRYRTVVDVAPKGAPRRQVTRTFRTLSEARTFVTETRAQVARGMYLAPSKVTLRVLAKDWLNTRLPGGVDARRGRGTGRGLVSAVRGLRAGDTAAGVRLQG
jgi:hypothetical protein